MEEFELSRTVRHVQGVFLLFLLSFSLLAAAPKYSMADSLNSGSMNLSTLKNNQTGSVTLGTYLAKSYPILIANTSYVVYTSSSNVSDSTAVMSAAQYFMYQKTGNIARSIYDQNGTQSLNALLLTEGTYFLVFLANKASANATFSLQITPALPSNSTSFVGELLTIPPGVDLSIPVHFQTLGSPSQFDLFGVSNQSIAYSIYGNSSGRVIFTSPSETVTNLSYQNGQTDAGYLIDLNESVYALHLDNTNQQSSALVYFDYHIIPRYVNPYLVTLIHQLPPAPTGIAALGLYNVSGRVTPYTIKTNSLVGFSKISSMQAVDPNFTIDTNANLQLNAVLQVENLDNSTYVYWPQNVMWFSTGPFPPDKQVTYRDSVVNLSGDAATLSNRSILGSGYVAGNPSMGYYYGNYNTPYAYKYAFPFTFELYLNETVQKGSGVWISEGIRVLQNGSAVTSSTTVDRPATWFDKALIVDPGVSNASFLISGDRYTPAGAGNPLGSFFDAELVFGGDLGGGSTSFSSMDAELSLFYYNGSLMAFPSVYPFGPDSSEDTYNLQATYNGQDVVVTTSSSLPSYQMLSNNYSSSLTDLESGISSSSPVFIFEGNALLYVSILGATIAIIIGLAAFTSRRKMKSPMFSGHS